MSHHSWPPAINCPENVQLKDSPSPYPPFLAFTQQQSSHIDGNQVKPLPHVGKLRFGRDLNSEPLGAAKGGKTLLSWEGRPHSSFTGLVNLRGPEGPGGRVPEAGLTASNGGCYCGEPLRAGGGGVLLFGCDRVCICCRSAFWFQPQLSTPCTKSPQGLSHPPMDPVRTERQGLFSSLGEKWRLTTLTRFRLAAVC